VFDERARAATVPLAAPAAAVSMAAPLASGSAVAQADADNDDTNPAVFMPARPGARQDLNRVSPGSYSQVNSARRQTSTRAPNTELEIPSAKLLLTKEAPVFEEADTTVRPQLAPGPDDASGAGKPRTETRSYVAARFNGTEGTNAAGAGERRKGGITEHPPQYVQRRDSNPTRMEIPVGPVGSPHRPFAPERLSASATPALRGSNHPFDMPVAEGAHDGLQAGVLPDSLTPPASATRTAPPEVPMAARPSALWLVSGVLAAIILLALGVGLKQWVAGGPPAPGVSHAASGRPSTPYEATLRAEPAQVAAPAPVEPAASGTSSEPSAPVAAPQKLGAPVAAPQPKPVRAEAKAPRPAAARRPAIKSARPAPAAPEPKRESPAVGLPDNPY
jgi:hypothetical protein